MLHRSVAPESRRPRPGPVLVRQHFGCIVFDRTTSRYYPFDQDATDVLLQLQTRPIETLLEAEGNSERAEVLWDFFERFHTMGFFTVDGHFSGVVLDNEVPEDHLAGPLAVHLEIVAACNLHCRHCFAGVLPRKEEPLTLDELDRLFAGMARMGSFRLGLTGGEPTLRRDLFEVIDLATSYGLHPCLTTNGLLVTEAMAREFGLRDLVWLNVSLDGATAATNDAIRGAGTFDRVLERIEMLARHARFTLAFTIMRSNLDEIRACADLAERLGALTAVFRPLYPVGIARNYPELMPDYRDYHEAIDQLTEYGYEGSASLRSIDPFSPMAREASQSIIHNDHGCGAGNLVCSISLSGDVNPCSFLGSSYAAANLRDVPFEEIWHRSQTFRAIRDLPGGTPDKFSGGCRARALVLNGSINAPDPWMTERDHLLAGQGKTLERGLLVNPQDIVLIGRDRPR
jgi:mycofactocin biosynthetic radical S-adenosylmethionine protein MftC